MWASLANYLRGNIKQMQKMSLPQTGSVQRRRIRRGHSAKRSSAKKPPPPKKHEPIASRNCVSKIGPMSVHNTTQHFPWIVFLQDLWNRASWRIGTRVSACGVNLHNCTGLAMGTKTHWMRCLTTQRQSRIGFTTFQSAMQVIQCLYSQQKRKSLN